MKNKLRSALAQDFSRRDLLKGSGIGLLGATACGWFPALAQELAENPRRKRQLILLWMSGGPSMLTLRRFKPASASSSAFSGSR